MDPVKLGFVLGFFSTACDTSSPKLTPRFPLTPAAPDPPSRTAVTHMKACFLHADLKSKRVFDVD